MYRYGIDFIEEEEIERMLVDFLSKQKEEREQKMKDELEKESDEQEGAK